MESSGTSGSGLKSAEILGFLEKGPVGGSAGEAFSDAEFIMTELKSLATDDEAETITSMASAAAKNHRLISIMVSVNDTSLLQLQTSYQREQVMDGNAHVVTVVKGPMRGNVTGASSTFYNVTGNGIMSDYTCHIEEGEHLVAVELVQSDQITGGFMVIEKIRFSVLKKGGKEVRTTSWHKTDPVEGKEPSHTPNSPKQPLMLRLVDPHPIWTGEGRTVRS